MARQIPLSFKETEEDLHNFLKEKSSPSAYVKELLKIAKEVEESGGNIYSINGNTNSNSKDVKKSKIISLSSLNVGR